MTTARDIVEAAWRRITKSSSEESLSAAEASDLLEILNDYLQGLETDCAYTHYTLSLSDTLQTPPDIDGALKAILTRDGAEEFGLPVSPIALSRAERAHGQVLAKMMTPTDLTVENGMFNTLHSNRYDIDAG